MSRKDAACSFCGSWTGHTAAPNWLCSRDSRRCSGRWCRTMSRTLGLSWNKFDLRNSTSVAAVRRPNCKLLNTHNHASFPQDTQREIFALARKYRVNFDRAASAFSAVVTQLFRYRTGILPWREREEGVRGALSFKQRQEKKASTDVPAHRKKTSV